MFHRVFQLVMLMASVRSRKAECCFLCFYGVKSKDLDAIRSLVKSTVCQGRGFQFRSSATGGGIVEDVPFGR